MKRITVVLAALMLLVSCGPSKYATVRDGQFIVDGQPYRFIGVNFWYGAVLGSQGEGGNRERLAQELDLMKSYGITNLRVLVGAQGNLQTADDDMVLQKDEDGNLFFGQAIRPSVVQPTLEMYPGKYNDEVLDGLDWFMAELGKRGMKAVLYLNNTWNWSGGYEQYLTWAHVLDAPIITDDIHGNPVLVEPWKNASKYYADATADSLFQNHVRFILGRTNRYTGVKYTEDPAIFSWQLGNEPRPLGRQNKQLFIEWIDKTAKLVRSLDTNHMISTGNEGWMGSDNDMEIVDAINAVPEISYMTIHIWPFNWGWIHQNTVAEELQNAIDHTNEYIDMHIPVAEKYGKPLVIEEFGYPRDGFQFKTGTPVTARDTYYSNIFRRLEESAQEKGILAGCNMWAWGGVAKTPAENDYWKWGDDYTGDPIMEQQGLNSVFVEDPTVMMITDSNGKLRGK